MLVLLNTLCKRSDMLLPRITAAQAQLSHSDYGQHNNSSTKSFRQDGGSGKPANNNSTEISCPDQTCKHHPALLNVVAAELGCTPQDIIDFELNLCDVQPGQLGGTEEEFVFVGRLDNLASCYTALTVRVVW